MQGSGAALFQSSQLALSCRACWSPMESPAHIKYMYTYLELKSIQLGLVACSSAWHGSVKMNSDSQAATALRQ